ncbi:MAG: hypothetical protein IH851_11965 [Armatimonadetes bacterium]|nr:hypothetical protein [Armatimonadota bacterium]
MAKKGNAVFRRNVSMVRPMIDMSEDSARAKARKLAPSDLIEAIHEAGPERPTALLQQLTKARGADQSTTDVARFKQAFREALLELLWRRQLIFDSQSRLALNTPGGHEPKRRL